MRISALLSSKKALQQSLLACTLFVSIGCNSPEEGFKSQIIRTDSLMIVRTATTDTMHLNQLRSLNCLMGIADKDIVNSGEEYKAKMFIMSDSLLGSPYGTGSYKMYFKLGSLRDTIYSFKEIEPINDTAYIRFIAKKNLKDSKVRSWSGKIIIKTHKGDSVFSLEQQYIIQQ